MNKLVALFEEKLGVSRLNATWRVIGTIAVLICAIAILALDISTLPFTASITKTISLLPGNYTQVAEIRDGDVMVGQVQFLQAAKGNTSFISVGKTTIAYMTKVGGVSYRYEENVFFTDAYDNISDRIENGVLIREMSRDLLYAGFVHIFLPFVLLFILLIFFVALENKNVWVPGSGDQYVYVWF